MTCRGSNGSVRIVHRERAEKGSRMRHLCSRNASIKIDFSGLEGRGLRSRLNRTQGAKRKPLPNSFAKDVTPGPTTLQRSKSIDCVTMNLDQRNPRTSTDVAHVWWLCLDRKHKAPPNKMSPFIDVCLYLTHDPNRAEVWMSCHFLGALHTCKSRMRASLEPCKQNGIL